MPPDGAVMVNAVDMLKSRAPAPGEPPLLYGMPLPAVINAVVGIADAPYLDIVAEFKTEAPAGQWEAQWPTRAAQAADESSAGAERILAAGDARAAGTRGTDRPPTSRRVARRDAALAGDGVALPHRPLRRRAAIAAPARSAGVQLPFERPIWRRREIASARSCVWTRAPPPRRPLMDAKDSNHRFRPTAPTKAARRPRRIVTYVILERRGADAARRARRPAPEPRGRAPAPRRGRAGAARARAARPAGPDARRRRAAARRAGVRARHDRLDVRPDRGREARRSGASPASSRRDSRRPTCGSA